ncbi:MAG: carboxypeptidase regulatory-like domain-containing protein [Myxococcales bacterium]|nr:carboxypeptidase regulatory-like domain-containing protein [Myxococcales bacterium]
MVSFTHARRSGSLVLVALLGGCATAGGLAARRAAVDAPSAASPGRRAAARVELPSCAPARGAHAPVAHAERGDPDARRAAQRGLAFVSREAVAWQGRNNCYGCHVQAVTFEALTVGREHQYDVSEPEFREVLRGLTDIRGGHRQPGGLSVGGGGMPATSRAFGGAAFARYDRTVDAALRDELVAVATQLIEYQNPDGSVRNDDTRFPVVQGPLQATTQALQTWHQAYSRSADERWLGPIREAEAWLQAQARRLTDEPEAGTVDLNYAVMGLLEAGAQPTEATLVALGRRLRERQSADGAWSFRPSGEANAFATGQTLHALRSLGASDDDGAVARGTRWLVTHQAEDGGWSHDGSGKAEAMWAVFGLVSVDVMSLALEGVRDGEHAGGRVELRARAVDNNGAAVRQVELLLDDNPVGRACGAALAQSVELGDLPAGVHTLDVVATNERGQQARRRIELYTGQYYLVTPGARWSEGRTVFSLRNVAPREATGTVRVRVRTPEGREVWRHDEPAAQGPVRVSWDGRPAQGDAAPAGRYVATLSYLDASGRAVQDIELPFVHDTVEAQQANYAQVQGQLNAEGAGGAANAEVELVDGAGRVVQRTQSTESGAYRFSNVDRGQYRVRVSRRGFRTSEAPVAAAPASTSRANMDLAH